MKTPITILLIAFSFILCGQTPNNGWPVKTNGSTAKVSGVPGESRSCGSPTRYHNGIDVVGNDISCEIYSVNNICIEWDMEIFSFETMTYQIDITATLENTDNNFAVLGGTKYWHTDVLNSIADNDPVVPNQLIGSTSWHHVHLMPDIVWTNNTGNEQNLLNYRFPNYQDNDPPIINNIKYFKDGVDRGHAGQQLLNLLYDKIDIVVDTYDEHPLYNGNTSNVGNNGINKIIWSVLDFDNNNLTNDIENISFDEFPLTASSEFIFRNGSNCNIHMYVVTNNNIPNTGNIYDRNFNTRLKNYSNYINNWDGLSAKVNEEAFFKDGSYTFEFKVFDFYQQGVSERPNPAIQSISRDIDNFLPYIEKVEIIGTNGYEYRKEYVWNSTSESIDIISPCETGTLGVGENYNIKIYASEPLAYCSLNINNVTFSLTSINQGNTIFQATRPYAGGNDVQIQVKAEDLAGNKLNKNPQNLFYRVNSPGVSPEWAKVYPTSNYNVSIGDDENHKINNSVPMPVCLDLCQSDPHEPNHPSPFALPDNNNPNNTLRFNDNEEHYDFESFICSPSDTDVYKLRIATKGVLNIQLSSLPFDYDLEVLDNSNNYESISAQNGVNNEVISFAQKIAPLPIIDNTIWVKVFSKNGTDKSISDSYKLSFTWKKESDQTINILSPIVNFFNWFFLTPSYAFESDFPSSATISVSNQNICIGQSTQINTSGLCSGIEYLWFPSSTLSCTDCPNPIATPTTSTTYTLFPTSSNQLPNNDESCYNPISVTVNVLQNINANAGTDITLPIGGSYTLQGSGNGLYSWSPSIGLSNPNIANPVATPIVTTSYILTVTNASGCIDKDTVIVNVVNPNDPCLVPNDYPCCADFLDINPDCQFSLGDISTSNTVFPLPIPWCDQPGVLDEFRKIHVTVPFVSLISRQFTGFPASDQNDVGIAFYEAIGGDCSNLSLIPGLDKCIKNSLNTGGGDYMPEAFNIDLSAFQGDTIYMRIWNYEYVNNPSLTGYGLYEMCLFESDNFCDPTIFSVYESNNRCTTTPLGEDALVKGEQQLISWKMTATQQVNNAVLGMYAGDVEIYRQAVSANIGDTICFCPSITQTSLDGIDTGMIHLLRLVIETNTNDINTVSKNSPLVCLEPIKVFTPQIIVNQIIPFRYNQNDIINFKVLKNIQEALNLKVTNLLTLAQYPVINGLPFDSVAYNQNLGLCSAPTWTIPSNAQDGPYVLTATSATDPNIFGSGANFIIGTCVDPPINFSNVETLMSTDFFCFLGFIPQMLDSIQIEDGYIPLDSAADITFRALYYLNPSAMGNVPSDDFPAPFQNGTTATFYKAIKALSYLTYQDFEPALPRDYFYINGNKLVSRKLAIRMLLEAFDIKPTSVASGVFTDVFSTTSYGNYINYAGSVGFVPNPIGSSFRPNDPITYEEFYNMLFRVMTGYNVSIPVTNPNPTYEDYYVPGNHKPEVMPYNLSSIDGHLSVVGGSAFGVKGKGLSLGFNFTYNSAQSEFPKEFYKEPENPNGYSFQTLGEGWEHNYNARVLFSQGNSNSEDRYVFVWPNSITTIYDPNTSTWVTKSNFDKILTLNSTDIIVQSKSLIKYHFKVVIGQNYYQLYRITDRYNNSLECTYVNFGLNNLPYLDKVTDLTNTSNYLKFNYTSGYPPKLEAVDEYINGSNTRNVSFVVNQSLVEYTDVLGSITKYEYSSLGIKQWKYLLTKVTLPKGNAINFEFVKSKLTKTSKANTYTQYNWTHDYTQSSSGYTECSVLNPSGNVLEYSKDDLGRVHEIEGLTSHFNATSFGSGDLEMLTTRWTYNDLDYGNNYDSRGNVTSNLIFSSSTVIADSSSYNSNDQKTYYADADGNEYIYGYNSTTNGLTSITLPGSLGAYTLLRNSNGEVTNVTNPEGIQVTRTINSTTGFTEAIENVSVSGATAKVEFQNLNDYGWAGEIIDPNSNITSYQFRDNGQVYETVNAINKTLESQFDANYNTIEVKNEKNEITSIDFTDEDWNEKYQFGTIQNQTSYNDDGTVNNYNQGGSSNNFSYNNLLQLQSAMGNTYEYYSNLSHLLKKAKNNTHDIERSFDYNNVQEIETIETEFHNGDTKKVEYLWTGNGNISYIYLNAPTNTKFIHYEYENDRCKFIYDWKSNDPVVEYEYYNDGRLKRELFRNGIIGTYLYDNGGRLIRIEYKDGSNVVSSNYFGLDDAGLHELEYFKVPNADAAFPYLTSYSQSFAPSPYNQNQGYTINGNQYQDVDVDNNGNITKIDNLNFIWDTKNMMSGIRENGSQKVQMKYNDANHLVYKRYFNHPIIDEVFFNVDLYGNVLEENYKLTDGSTKTIYYIYGPNGLICRHFGIATEFYHFDYRGSTLATTDQNKEITHSFTYNLYTGEVSPVRSNQDYDDDYPFTRCFIARWGVQEELYGLHLMGLRYHSEELQSFMKPDPVYWADNMYSYANNNGVDFIDPNGAIFFNPSLTFVITNRMKLKYPYNYSSLIYDLSDESLYRTQTSYGGNPESLENFRNEFYGKSYNEIAVGRYKRKIKNVTFTIPLIPNDISNEEFDFIELSNGRTLDLTHFMVVGTMGTHLGFLNEAQQTISSPGSESNFYPQDIYSNELGVKFFNKYSMKLMRNPDKISEYIYEFLSNPNNL